MIEIEFYYNQNIIIIQAEKNNKFQDIINKYLQKSLLNPTSLFFLCNGKKINPTKTVETEMNALDRQNKKLKVCVNYIEQGTPEINFITKSEVKDNLEKKKKELEERNLNNEKVIDNLNQRIKEL